MEEPMTFANDFDGISKDLVKGVSTTKTNKINIYLAGVSTKLTQAEYALVMIRELSKQNTYTTNETASFTIEQRLEFFVDSFFAFLYSTLDITSQAVNQKIRLGIREQYVTFKAVEKKLSDIPSASKPPNPHLGTPVQKAYKKLRNNRKFFKPFEKYRNCATHRRQICTVETTIIQKITPCYSSTEPMTDVERLLCDDPFAVNHTFKKTRELVAYTTELLQWVKSQILVILKNA
jgi:hypothetical protein